MFNYTLYASRNLSSTIVNRLRIPGVKFQGSFTCVKTTWVPFPPYLFPLCPLPFLPLWRCKVYSGIVKSNPPEFTLVRSEPWELRSVHPPRDLVQSLCIFMNPPPLFSSLSSFFRSPLHAVAPLNPGLPGFV